MNRLASLLSLLRSEGPASPSSLMTRLAVSQPTLFRAVKAHPMEIIGLGGARNRKLAALRNVRGMGAQVPIFLISEEGEVHSIGTLLSLYSKAFAWVQDARASRFEVYPGFPFFLEDIRPQGFLGKSFSQRNADLNLPLRILDWSNDDTFEALAKRGEDLLGNLLIGEETLARYQKMLQKKAEVVDDQAPEPFYLRYAQAALDGEPSGSSVGGEHPKFSAVLSSRQGVVRRVLVKFSPAGDSFAAERWRDLLICEALALELLREHAIASAQARVIVTRQRTFLETLRFDRLGFKGRRGVLSLSALENEWVGRSANWAVSAKLLEQGKRISVEDFNLICKIEAFGRMIANSDRHSGNLSFYWNPGEKKARLAPVYDMLPMLYAPTSGGEDAGRDFSLPLYEPLLLPCWKEVLPIAVQYWDLVSQDARISKSFRKIAAQNIKVLRNSPTR